MAISTPAPWDNGHAARTFKSTPCGTPLALRFSKFHWFGMSRSLKRAA